MHRSPLDAAAALLSCVVLISSCGSAGPPPPIYGPGSTLSRASFADQFGVDHPLDESVRLVLFSRDMDGGAIIRELLAADPELLARFEAVYVADISGMPGFVANAVAIPRMRERPYPTLLDRDGALTAGFPWQRGHATLLWLERLRIRSVEHRDSLPGLREALRAAPRS